MLKDVIDLTKNKCKQKKDSKNHLILLKLESVASVKLVYTDRAYRLVYSSDYIYIKITVMITSI